MSSADCDPTRGTRTCDISQPGGYCYLEGCDARSCPQDSVCIRVFPGSLLTKPCSDTIACAVDELCLAYDDASASQAGTGTGSYCARMSLERRLCLQSCGSDGDCRGGYACVQAGTTGTLALTVAAAGAAAPKFCTAR